MTLELLNILQKAKAETLEAWGNGVYIGESCEETAMKNAKALGGLDVLEQIISHIEQQGNDEGVKK